MLPLISVVTITFNSEKTVEETIRSVVSQDYPNLEYIIIDGGSTDSTLQIVDRYRDRIALVQSEPDKGISDAFNKGILKASGEIIGIINSDDLLSEGALKAIADNYDPSIDVYSGKRVIDIFMENTDPDLVTFELDAAWAWRAGVNAAEFIREHSGRFELIHVKER